MKMALTLASTWAQREIDDVDAVAKRGVRATQARARDGSKVKVRSYLKGPVR